MPLSASLQMPWFLLNASELFQGQLIYPVQGFLLRKPGEWGRREAETQALRSLMARYHFCCPLSRTLGLLFWPSSPTRETKDRQELEFLQKTTEPKSAQTTLCPKAVTAGKSGDRTEEAAAGRGPDPPREATSSNCRNHSDGWPWLEVQDDVKSKATGQRAQVGGGANRLGRTAA